MAPLTPAGLPRSGRAVLEIIMSETVHTPSTSDFLWFAQLSRDGEFIGTREKPP